ncbi:NAD(P)/FAD-dependent oxidoreductase [Tepidanaerobacter syntrophicus]|uniref:NAD(P)/FAD-dependent oxidoreductase n=1 Tax=Tepidanaerobacter syntrophicus TaxID=224999 RepID=UPI001BD60264|nr:FAD-dependent oxidoreductase [Tepidanaerobacter syntrophicus]
MTDPVVIIGNGIAAVSAAEAFRENDRGTPVIILSGEPYYAYYRMWLSSLLGEPLDLDKLYIHKPEWYAELNIDVWLNCKADSLDTENCTVLSDNGKTIKYSKLLLANGSSPFIPPVAGNDLTGVFSIRSLDDVKKVNEYISDKENGIVVGGGVLGLEVAWSLANKGKKVSVIEGSPYILSKQVDETASHLLMALGEKAGINFVTNGKLTEIIGENGKVTSIQLEGKTMPAEFVVFSTGVRSNISLVKNTPIKVGRGVQVNEYMQTSVENVYAAGDIAEYKGQVYGIWPVAREQGKTAGLNMAGKQVHYNEVVPSNYLKVFGVELYSVGDLCKDGKPFDSIKKLDKENNKYSIIFIRDSKPVGAVLFGDTKPAMKISKAIKSNLEIPEEIIRNSDFEGLLAMLQ